MYFYLYVVVFTLNETQLTAAAGTNFAEPSLSILEPVEFHCDPLLLQSVSLSMKWIWI